jgi:cytochrome c oxidase subunit III
MERRSVAVRAHPLVFGVVLFLASELMLFAALFAAYYDLRAYSAHWPPSDVHLDLLESSIGTALLAISSLTMLVTQHFLTKERFEAARRCVFASALLGIGFLAIAVDGWSKATFSIASHAYGSLFYMMTGFHALHVTAGILLLAALIVGLTKPAFTAQHFAGAEAIGYYWHFVFIVWAGIYATIYLVR